MKELRSFVEFSNGMGEEYFSRDLRVGNMDQVNVNLEKSFWFIC